MMTSLKEGVFLKSRYGYIIALVMVIIFGISAYSFYVTKSLKPPEVSDIQPGQEEWIRGKDRINILLLGTDDDLGTNSRTDSIILASLDTNNKKVSLLSIPRDTRVNIPGYGYNRINSANALGGVDLTKSSISNLIKVPIDYYVMTNFEGFKGIVDTLGGVEIDVEQNMKYRTYDGMIDLKKGVQRLDGDKALQYVRFRHDKLGDITRTQRQQKFLTALAKEMLQAKNIVKIPVLIPKLNEAVKTDLSISQMIGLAKEFGNYDLNSITVQTLPGNFINGDTYWHVDDQKAHQMVLEVFAGKSADIIDNNITGNTVTNSAYKSTKKSVSPKKQKKNNIEPKEPVNEIIIIDDNNTAPKENGIENNPVDNSPKDDSEPKEIPTENNTDENTLPPELPQEENNIPTPEEPSNPTDNMEIVPQQDDISAPVNPEEKDQNQ